MKIQVLGLALFIGGILGCATQEDIVVMDDRLSRLEKQNAQFRQEWQSSTENEEDLRSKSATLRATLEEIRADIQALYGKIEETEFRLKQEVATVNNSHGQLQERLTSLQERTQALEQYLHLEKSTPPKGDGSPAKSTKAQELTADQLYEQAKKDFDAGNYQVARERFQGFIKKYPQAQQADNAQFWIGETYYQEKWYQKAILEYQKVIDTYPQGNKVPSALLKQGYAFANIGEKANARLIWNELLKKYPRSNEADIARQKLKSL